MKTAVSIPDAVFRAAEALARRLRKSRSRLYAEAVAEYLDRHAPEAITAQIDAALEAHGDPTMPGVLDQGTRILRGLE